MVNVTIIGTGSYLPGEPITNEQLASVFGRQIIWLSEMLGARTRHLAVNLARRELPEGESNSRMATQAARQAISSADIDPMAIDLIIMATSTPDYPFPATALFVQEQLGIPRCCVFELRAGCGGMAQAFLIATHLIRAGASRMALLIGSDMISPFMSLAQDPNGEISNDFLVSLAMFGDGAGAVILAPSTAEAGILDCMSQSISTGNPPGMILRTGGALSPVGYRVINRDGEEKIFSHDFKTIMERGPNLITATRHWLVREKGFDLSNVDYFIPPQVNSRLIDLVASQMNVASTKVVSNFERVGNTVSASIYIALDQLNREKILKPNDLLVLLPTEATKWLYGAVVLRWTLE